MKCPFCPRFDSRVIDSRLSKDGCIIRRRRVCEGCDKRFTTYERVEESLPAVAKKDGRRETFDRAKIANGIKKACEKRPVSTETIDSVVDRVEQFALGGPGGKGGDRRDRHGDCHTDEQRNADPKLHRLSDRMT